MGKRLDGIDLASSVQRTTALSEPRENRNSLTHNILDVDFRPGAVLPADHDSGAADVLHPALLDPELLGVVGVDSDRRRNVCECGMNQGKPCLVLPYRGDTLTLKGGVNERELPPG